jgi:hypothetical protein
MSVSVDQKLTTGTIGMWSSPMGASVGVGPGGPAVSPPVGGGSLSPGVSPGDRFGDELLCADVDGPGEGLGPGLLRLNAAKAAAATTTTARSAAMGHCHELRFFGAGVPVS